jgi:lipoprotein NlpD
LTLKLILNKWGIELTKTVKLLFLCVLVTGCAYDSFHYPDAEYQRTAPRVSDVPKDGVYRVQPGDTLFSIAFNYGLDYRKVAEYNGIDSPYVIYPQQKIQLKEKAAAPPVKTASTASSAPKTPAASVIKTPVVSPTSSAEKPSKPVVKTVKVNGNSNPKTTSNNTETANIAVTWAWPVTGKVTRGFSSQGVSSKGIDIKGAEDSRVKAAADGVVVYAGNNLIGYGNLVIVKHNDVYLSAYAYNDSILVKEKQSVKQGDALAIIGGKGNERPILHFEVRRDGQPIDPLKVLPTL